MSKVSTTANLLEFDFINEEVNNLKKVTVDPRCNTIMITNTGLTILWVNNFPLHPGTAGVSNGESITLGGNRGEIFTGRIDLRFATNQGVALVTQKYYKNI